MATLGLNEAERAAVERFEREVMTPSMSSLVVLQFTASWCGPCKQLSPILEKVTAELAPQGVQLVRIDIDEQRIIADQFRIQSVPTVYALYRGQPVGDLTPYRSEGQLRQILEQLVGRLGVKGEAQALEAQVDPLLQMAEQVLEDGDAPRAENILRQVLELAPYHPEVNAALARALVAQQRGDEARALLDGLDEKTRKDPAVARARAALELASAAPVGDSAELEARAAANPDDLDTQFELAQAQIAAGDRDRAADLLLEIVGKDREWREGEARQRFLQLLEAQGLGDPWSRNQRRRLSALLFT
ncbi:tetratricopeptide repeat protein [Sphingomonas ginkgonis]|uniref:tetratricopeptide repeat protein n=1 Tax=Sphingomonas ginkgonis TaxID=2315330 RepID=UPI001EEF992B|nr:tetratricopeptide repeat protein [Sphingomonas ginkgonis]